MNPKFTFLLTLLFVTHTHSSDGAPRERSYRTVRLIKPGEQAEFFILYAGTLCTSFLETIRTRSGNRTPKIFTLRNGGESISLPDILSDDFLQTNFPDGQTMTFEIIEYAPAERRRSSLGFNV